MANVNVRALIAYVSPTVSIRFAALMDAAAVVVNVAPVQFVMMANALVNLTARADSAATMAVAAAVVAARMARDVVTDAVFARRIASDAPVVVMVVVEAVVNALRI